jgi:hypothetical protein
MTVVADSYVDAPGRSARTRSTGALVEADRMRGRDARGQLVRRADR